MLQQVCNYPQLLLASPLSHGAHRSTVDCTLNSDGVSNLVGHCANAAWPWPSPSEQVTALAQGRLQLSEEKQHAIHVPNWTTDWVIGCLSLLMKLCKSCVYMCLLNAFSECRPLSNSEALIGKDSGWGVGGSKSKASHRELWT